MPNLSPSTRTQSDRKAILLETAAYPRDHAMYPIALSLGQTPSAIQEPSDAARAAQILAETGMAVLPDFKDR